MKFALGTVQFGLNYGINNSKGKPSREEVFKILDYAYENGVKELDTADTYGDALEVIGEWQSSRKLNFEIMSKLVLDNNEFISRFNENLRRLNVSNLFGIYFHRFNDFKSFKQWEIIHSLKSSKTLRYFGVSVYGNEELSEVVAHPEVDVIQVPFNLFDQGEEKRSLLCEAKKNGKLIYIRSVYLQGLMFKSPSDLSGNLIGFREKIEQLNLLKKENSLSIEEMALHFCKSLEFIDKIIMGVDGLNQLKTNIEIYGKSIPILDYSILNFENSFLLNPSNWKI